MNQNRVGQCAQAKIAVDLPQPKERPDLEVTCEILGETVGVTERRLNNIENLIFASMPTEPSCLTNQTCEPVVTIGGAIEVSISRLGSLNDRLEYIEKRLCGQFGNELHLIR